MEGFNLFQDKIVGQGNNKKGVDPKIFFYQQESMSAEMNQMFENEVDALSFGKFGQFMVDFQDEEFSDFNDLTLSTVEFKIEYVKETSESLEDFRDVFYNFNNGISSEHKKTMIVFFD